MSDPATVEALPTVPPSGPAALAAVLHDELAAARGATALPADPRLVAVIPDLRSYA